MNARTVTNLHSEFMHVHLDVLSAHKFGFYNTQYIIGLHLKYQCDKLMYMYVCIPASRALEAH